MAQHTTNYNLEKQQGNDLVNINGINNNFDIIDTEINEAQNRMQKAVGTLSELKAVTGVPENTTILCKGLGLYRYDASSAAAPDDFFIVAPSLGAGRWILMAETAMGFSADTGSTNAYVLTLPGLSAYYTGMMVWFKPVNGNTGACTINVNALGAKSLVRPGGVVLTSGDITAGALICAVYDGTNFQLISLLAANLVHLTATQTLTNKTLTSPILTTPKFATAGYITDANGNELIRFPSTIASAVNEITVNNAATGVPPCIQSSGSDTNVGLDIKSKGTGTIRNYVNNVVSVVFDAAASAVNSLTMKSNATNNSPSIEAAGSDANVGIDVKTKGTGVFRALVNGVVAFVVDTVAGAVNYLTVKANTAGNAPTIVATGTDTNIDVNVVPKGIGRLKENGTAVIRQGEDYRPNILDNGDFKIWSKGDSFTNPSFAYTADKWYAGWDGTGGTNVISKQSGSPTSQSNFLRFQCSALSTGGTYKLIENRAMDLNITSDCMVTVSAWLKCDSSRTISLNLYQVFGTGGSTALGYYPASKTVSTSWAMYSWTVKLSSIIGKTVGTDAYFCTQFVLPYNATFTLDIANVKLEINDHATPFIPKSYKEELLNTSDNVGYAPNLLTNGDFQVWQRGTSFDRTSLSGRFYSADRWSVFRSSLIAGAIVSKINEGLSFTNPGGGSATTITQTLETAQVIKLRGKTVTLSFKAKSSAAVSLITSLPYSNSGSEQIPGATPTGKVVQNTFLLDSNFKIFQITGTVPNDATGLLVDMGFYDTAAVTLEYVKLEVNDHATPHIPKTYSEELELCQRYYEIVNGGVFAHASSITFAQGLSAYVSFLTPKRVVPTVTRVSDIAITNCNTPFASLISASGFQAIAIPTSNTGPYFLTRYAADAEI